MGKAQNITGVILAGGQSSRFGTNKALALLRGKFLIQHVRDTLASVFDDCLLITNTPEEYMFLNMPMIKDRYQNMGPLGGIHAALHHSRKPWVFIIGCDMPAVTPEVITFLCSLAKKEFDAVIPCLETGPEPLCGLYHKTALETIELELKNHKTRIKNLLEVLSVREAKEEELHLVVPGSPVFLNVNRKQDLNRLP